MKKFLTIITILIVLISAAGFSQKKKINWKNIQILVYTKNGKGYVHKNVTASVQCLKKLSQENGFALDVSDTAIVFTEDNLKKYNAIIFSNTNNEVFDTPAQKLAFRRYIEAGGGFIGIHSATGTERQWKWFKMLVGATFLRHPPMQKFQSIILDAGHPSTASLPRIWEHEDECYYVKEVNPLIKVLVAHDLRSVKDKEKPDTFGDYFPSVWCSYFDGCRSWYTAYGHNDSDYSDKLYISHLLGGIAWVVNDTKPDFSKAYASSPDEEIKALIK